MEINVLTDKECRELLEKINIYVMTVVNEDSIAVGNSLYSAIEASAQKGRNEVALNILKYYVNTINGVEIYSNLVQN